MLDLFRMRDINTSYTGVGFGGDDDMTLDSEEFSQLLLKNTQCRFKKNDIQAVVDFLDQDGNGELDILELEAALRHARNVKRNIPQVWPY